MYGEELMQAFREFRSIWYGFSCKTQIEQGMPDRRALHTAQVLKMAIDHGKEGTPHDENPEEQYPDVVFDGNGYKPSLKVVAIAGVALASGTLAWGLKRRFDAMS